MLGKVGIYMGNRLKILSHSKMLICCRKLSYSGEHLCVLISFLNCANKKEENCSRRSIPSTI